MTSFCSNNRLARMWCASISLVPARQKPRTAKTGSRHLGNKRLASGFSHQWFNQVSKTGFVPKGSYQGIAFSDAEQIQSEAPLGAEAISKLHDESNDRREPRIPPPALPDQRC